MSIDLSAFNTARDGILSQIEQHELASIKASLTLLSTLRDEVEDAIKANWIPEFDLTRLRLVRQELERHIAKFENELGVRLMSDLRTANDLGVRLVQEPMLAV